ncbi:glycoside hydrolase family 5 protein [Lophiostoma macrostomum CBS 122681]|uniref:Glycoside hydrolase family 5 protein n=1 Tax=Lophiostoma macrostomum CBS 122681 TaxID=1314788 RepID=A0A6A6TLF1_9PLEO|nr:glycoside hydrolase family 5 protein [Lophiostoma macrostomum CBS 122681]
MHLLNYAASLLSIVSLTGFVAADLRIKADHFSFGGVNFPGLQELKPEQRDEAIQAVVKSGARVIRLFIGGFKIFPDPELEVGSFDQRLLDIYDNTLAAIHRISKGKLKVIIAPHDAHALRGTNEQPCDAYCKMIDGAFLDFYSNETIREYYKTRLQVFFKEYPSLNFEGRSWSSLNEVILGVDLQNEPWSGIWPIVAGEAWLCDIATHLKDTLELGQNNIAVITGGISGPQSPGGTQNFPDSAFDCKAVDVIGIHGFYALEEEQTAGTPWANMFVPGNTLTARALGKKLLLVEEMSYMNTRWGLGYKKAAIWDQGNALNYRGIPWLYSYLTHEDEGTTAKVSTTRADNFAIGALKNGLKRASTARSNFDWSGYLPAPSALSNLTHVPLNPFTPDQSFCTFGCPGYLCDAADGCRPDLICKNSVCTAPAETQPGIIGSECNSKATCQEHLRCEDGICQECAARPSIQPIDPVKGKGPFAQMTVAGDPESSCHLDTDNPFNMRPWCLKPQPFSAPDRRGNPCQSAAHCDANEYCDWGLCKACKDGDACLGAKCKGNNKCKTGFCNIHGRCDYPAKPKKISGSNVRNGGRKGPGWNAGPKGQASGPNKVRNEPMKVNIPKDKVQATGQPVAT